MSTIWNRIATWATVYLTLRPLGAIGMVVAIVHTMGQLQGWWPLVLMPAAWVMGDEIGRVITSVLRSRRAGSEMGRG